MKIGLVGNQNSGKTTLFNCLTGMNSKIGNWPGVTIEKKIGKVKNTEYEIIDLPGIYSLSPYTIEEKVARNFIFNEKPEVIINIIDAMSLERSLYLTTQLLELDCKVIVALNMADILEKNGININIEKLERKLGTKIIKISALKGTGINELIKTIKSNFTVKQYKIYDSNIENAILNIENKLDEKITNTRFVAIKILEEDNNFKKYDLTEIKEIISKTKQYYEDDLEEIIAMERYEYIEKIKKETIIKGDIKETISDKLDKIFLNKWLSFPIFIIIMFLVYYVSVEVIGNITENWISEEIGKLSKSVLIILEKFGTSNWIKSLIVDGIIKGVGAVVKFIPQLTVLFLCIEILETTGYMPRIALLLDKIFKKIGLSGKSLIPFIIGSGCSVTGIMGARIIENEDERNITTVLTPFIPCSAKLPIIALFSGYFFKENSGVVSVSLYFLAVVIIICSALIMKKLIFKNTSSTFISELPEYKLPSAKYIIKSVFEKVSEFIKRAGSIILICSIAIWFLLSFSCNLKYGVNIEDSILASIGKKISWIFCPIVGKNSWEIAVSVIQGIIAKEQVISSMSVISGLSQGAVENQMFTTGEIFSFFTPTSAYAFVVFNLFSAPCFGAIGAMKKELGGFKKALKAIILQTVFAWYIATFIYQIGSRIEKVNIINLVLIGIIIIIVSSIIIKRINNNECIKCPYSKDCIKRY